MNQPSYNPYAAPESPILIHTHGGEIRLAPRISRLGAALIDGVTMLLCIAPLAFSSALVNMLMDPTEGSEPAPDFTSKDEMIVVVIALLLFGLLIMNLVLLARNGQTLGKKLLGIKIIRSNHEKASFTRVFWLRTVVNSLITMIPAVGSIYSLVDVLFIFSQNKQCLHDLIADTIVVNVSTTPGGQG